MEQLLGALARTGQVRDHRGDLGASRSGPARASRVRPDPRPDFPQDRGNLRRHCCGSSGSTSGAASGQLPLRVAFSSTAWTASCRMPCAGATAVWRRFTISAGRYIPSCTQEAPRDVRGALPLGRAAGRPVSSRCPATLPIDLIRHAGVPASANRRGHHGLDPAFANPTQDARPAPSRASLSARRGRGISPEEYPPA